MVLMKWGPTIFPSVPVAAMTQQPEPEHARLGLLVAQGEWN